MQSCKNDGFEVRCKNKNGISAFAVISGEGGPNYEEQVKK